MNINQNNKINMAANYISSRMPSAIQQHPNPVESLSVEDIEYLQIYLENIKRSSGKTINNSKQKMNANIMPNIANAIPHRATNQTTSSFPNNRATDIYDPIEREVPVDWREYESSQKVFLPNDYSHTSNIQFEPGVRGAAYTRMPKKSQQTMDRTNNISQHSNQFKFPDEIGNFTNNYHNPYEHGAKQNSMGSIYKKPYNGPYNNEAITARDLGLSDELYAEKFPGHVRNVNIESSLLQHEMTHLPGQRALTQKDFNRFELLPYDPQDHKHIVWKDNMPRGGYSTRSDRLEL